MPGWSASRTIAASLCVIERAEPGGERRRLTLRVPIVHDEPRPLGQVQGVADAQGVVAEDHDDLVDATS